MILIMVTISAKIPREKERTDIESMILLWIQHFQQCGGRIAVKIAVPNLIYLVPDGMETCQLSGLNHEHGERFTAGTQDQASRPFEGPAQSDRVQTQRKCVCGLEFPPKGIENQIIYRLDGKRCSRPHLSHHQVIFVGTASREPLQWTGQEKSCPFREAQRICTKFID
jgi:hypothetical protein